MIALSGRRLKQGLRILRFRRRVRHLPLTLSASHIPLLPNALFLGRGFRWLPTHTQRLYLCRLPQCEHWLRTDRPSASGGDPLLHGVELHAGRDRPGHTLVLGPTRVGKTRLAELLIIQDIRRGDTVIVFNPKGDADLLRRVWAEAHRALVALGSARTMPVSPVTLSTSTSCLSTTPASFCPVTTVRHGITWYGLPVASPRKTRRVPSGTGQLRRRTGAVPFHHPAA